ncbi:hypothetical protein [Fulvimarina sp. MAC3]|uniref:hypothetical protein n=1 Tax=Fulvimarina sp. MAC3 TaxID=3148887 RepID=UPI0031FD67AE
MNRFAAVLAADSATTVTQWKGGKREERYFKGANKIFQFSDHHPVGLMIFDGAEVMGVPWEIVIKEFRKELGEKSFNHLTDYAEEFLRYLSENGHLFPDSKQRAYLIGASTRAALDCLPELPNNKLEAEEARLLIDEGIQDHLKDLENNDLPYFVPSEIEEDALSGMVENVASELESWLERLPFQVDCNALAKIGIKVALRNPERYMGKTGLVFSGFGDLEIFPTMAEYHAYAVVGGHLLSTAKQPATISHDVQSHIEGFAQYSMTDTFISGLGFEVYYRLATALEDEHKKLADTLCDNFGLSADRQGIEQALKETREGIDHRLFEVARTNHALPLRNVLSVLPIDEMTELAETLVQLESLKEKVTKPSESVGGPIDVAVITKSEGLVWIKRKHFFQSDLNPRFMLRKSALYK